MTKMNEYKHEMTIIYCNIKIMKMDNQISIAVGDVSSGENASALTAILPSYYQQSIYYY